MVPWITIKTSYNNINSQMRSFHLHADFEVVDVIVVILSLNTSICK